LLENSHVVLFGKDFAEQPSYALRCVQDKSYETVQ